MRYKKYPSYKDSGVEWLGDIPEHWVRTKLSFIFTNTNAGEVIDKNYWGSGEELLYTCKRTPLISDYSMFPKTKRTIERDLLLTRNGTPYVHKPKVNSIYSNVVQRITLNKNINRDFTAWSLDSGAVNVKGYGVSIESLNFEMWKELVITIPTIQEQKSIANYLDKATNKIDTLIIKQKRLVELLKEKRQALISKAVTRGLDDSVEMKESGVKWLGEIPKHWKLPQIARILLLMEQGKSPECDNNIAGLNVWGVLKTSCVNNGIYNSEANKTLPSSIKPFTQYEVKEEDILMSRASGSINLIGSVAYVYKTRNKILLSDKIFRIYVDKSVNKIFFTYLMGSEYMRTNIEMSISGGEGMANNIAKSAITKFKIALPPIKEQQTIINYLDQKTTQIDILISKATKAITLLQEKRTALISAVVTGKIDVRGI